MHQRVAASALALFSLAVAGCVKTEDLSSGDPLSGAYVGNLQDSLSGAGSMSLALTQSGSDVQGTWSAKFGSASTGGLVIGTARTATANLEFGQASGCSFRAAVFLSDNNLRGSYDSINCAKPFTGSLQLTRRE